MSLSRFAFAALALPVLAACADRTTPTSSLSGVSLASGPGLGSQVVTLRDDCEPKSFNAVLGPGGCVKNGSVTFQRFMAELTEKKIVGAWKNNPAQFAVPVGTNINVQNIGGETHTFTHVAKFGGGIVPSLNQLSGNLTVATECTQLTGADFVAAGTQFNIPTGPGGKIAAGDHLFQCCIHPWMRTKATLRTS